jgi:hypothetical protein
VGSHVGFLVGLRQYAESAALSEREFRKRSGGSASHDPPEFTRLVVRGCQARLRNSASVIGARLSIFERKFLRQI